MPGSQVKRPAGVLVLGIGNLVMSDDGFGVHAVKELMKDQSLYGESVEFLDAGTSIVDQLSELAGADRLICIDVADGGGKPGTIYRFKPDDVTYKKSRFHNAHKVSIFDALEMVGSMGYKAPETVIIAVEPENINWGTELSSTLRKVMPDVIKLVKKEVGNACASRIEGNA